MLILLFFSIGLLKQEALQVLSRILLIKLCDNRYLRMKMSRTLTKILRVTSSFTVLDNIYLTRHFTKFQLVMDA